MQIQEIYTMILNLGISTVIVIIFLYQYIKEINDKDKEKKKTSDILEEIKNSIKELVDAFKK